MVHGLKGERGVKAFFSEIHLEIAAADQAHGLIRMLFAQRVQHGLGEVDAGHMKAIPKLE